MGSSTGIFSWVPDPAREFLAGIYHLLFAVNGIDDLTPQVKAVPTQPVLAERNLEGGIALEEGPPDVIAESTVTPIPFPVGGSPEAEEESVLPAPGTVGGSSARKADPVPQYGGIYIDSLPSGIPIVLDGKTLGAETPKMIFGLSEGSHTVKISNDKKIFSVYEQQVWVYKGMISAVKFDISPELKKKLKIQSELFTGDQFTVNGRYPVYRIPTTITLKNPGSFLTILHNGSYITKEISDYLDPGAAMAILPAELRYGSIHVESDPAGADILADGFPTGLKAPCIVGNLSEGRHILTISKLGHLPSQNSLMVMDNPAKEIDGELRVTLEPYAYGELSVNSTPKGATVVLEKLNFRRTTPCTFQYMNIGSYSMKVTQSGETRVVEFEIAPGVGREFIFDVKEGTFIEKKFNF